MLYADTFISIEAIALFTYISVQSHPKKVKNTSRKRHENTAPSRTGSLGNNTTFYVHESGGAR